MTGYRLTLKKLAKKYGVDIEGATYAKVIQEIVNENVARASKKMGDLSNRRMKQAFEDSVKDGIITLPDYAIPNVTVRKGAEDGKMITDTLRDVLTRGLRKAITDNPNDTEKAIAQMQSHVKDTFATYTTSHAKMIAVTEVRSSVDLSKAEYVRELIARNPNKLRVTKKWIHHDHLVKIPRPTHKAIDGEKVLFNQPFSIGLMYPHDPNAPASEVIGCQCGYQVEVEEMAINEAWKALYQKLRVYKAYRVGTRRQRADGYTYEKQADGSWLRVKEQENGIHGEQGTDNQGQSAGGQADSGRVPRQSSIQGMDTGLQDAGNNRSDRGVGSVGNKALERWVAVDDFHTKFGESPVRVFDSGVVETKNKELFSKQFMKLRNENPLGLKVSARTPHDLRGAQMFMSPDGSYTCAVTKDGVLTAVCGTVHKGDYDFTDHSLKPLLRQAIQSGAKKADCYGKELLSLYKAVGYKVVGQADWNPKYWNENKDNSPQNETDPMKVFPEENGQPKYYYLAYTDENPEVQDVSDWEWEDIEKLQNSFAKKSPVAKASAGINPATGKPWQIGDTKVRPDGSKWVKTGTFSWAKAGTKDAEEAKKKTDKNGDGKKEWQEIEGQSSKDAEDILGVYGEKGLYQLTKGGLLNLLHAHGVDDPKSLKWAEKVEKVKEIVEEMQASNDGSVKVKTQGKEEFTEEDMHILHNTDLVGDASRLENETVHTRNGDVILKFNEDGGLTDKCYDELKEKIDPIRGDHWGSANTTNATALAVALVNAPDWKPIDQMKNGQLAKYDQQLSDGMYIQSLIKGIGLRKHAQEALKNPDMSREKIPNFFRGMTVDASQYEQILAGEVDTIELTGCTAVTSFEEVADQYASSSWTRSFGEGRRSIKLVIERDDYMDNSIGMFHHNTKGYAHGNSNIGFELLTGSPSFYIKSVEQKNADAGAVIDKFIKTMTHNPWSKEDIEQRVKTFNEAKKDAFGNYVYTDEKGYQEIVGYSEQHYNDSKKKWDRMLETYPMREQMYKVEEAYLKEHLGDFLDNVKNGRIRHANNYNAVKKLEDGLTEEWKKKVKGYKEMYESAVKGGYDSDEQEKFDILPRNNIGALRWRGSNDNLYNEYKEAKDAKYKPMTMKMFLDKKKPLAKSYETQMKKTASEKADYDEFYKWRAEVLNSDRRQKFVDDFKDHIKSKYGLTDEQTESMFWRDTIGFAGWNVQQAMNDSEKFRELKEEISDAKRSDPLFKIRDGLPIGKDNPWIKGISGNDKFADKSDNYTDNRYKQLNNIVDNYENAKRENELIDKYDIYNTPKNEIQTKYDESQNRYNDIKGAMNKYVADSWLEKQGWDLGNLTQSQEMMRDELYRGSIYYLNQNERDDYDNFRKDLKEKDKEYQKLEKQREEEGTLNGELTYALGIYNEYNDKIADAHKSSGPLVVHVVCGRGKKSMTAGADDQLEDNNDNS